MLIRSLSARLRLPLLAICVPVALPAQMEEAPRGYTCYGCAPSRDSTALDREPEPESYMGRDEDGVPHYIERAFSAEERQLLREQFGIEDPSRLYLSDSSSHRYLVYDTERDREGVVVMSARVGASSVRRPGESWEQLERRVRRMRASSFDLAVRVADPEDAGRRTPGGISSPRGGNQPIARAPGVPPVTKGPPYVHRHVAPYRGLGRGRRRGRRQSSAPAHAAPMG
jgi:hypothetical protein